MAESIQHKLDRVRSPRVHITYDVETLGAIVKKELPFLVGVISDLSGKPEKPLPPFNERRFTEIDRDNFNHVLKGLAPRLAFRVKNKLREGGEDTELNIELKFKKIEDFEPVNIVKQVEPLKKLLKARERLNDLLSSLEGNDKLEAMLFEISQDSSKLSELKKLTASSEKTKTEKKETKKGTKETKGKK